MKTVLGAIALFGLTALGGLATFDDAEARTSGCRRVVLPNSKVFEAIWVCRRSDLPSWWQRIESLNIGGGDAVVEPASKKGYCHYYP